MLTRFNDGERPGNSIVSENSSIIHTHNNRHLHVRRKNCYIHSEYIYVRYNGLSVVRNRIKPLMRANRFIFPFGTQSFQNTLVVVRPIVNHFLTALIEIQTFTWYAFNYRATLRAVHIDTSAY